MLVHRYIPSQYICLQPLTSLCQQHSVTKIIQVYLSYTSVSLILSSCKCIPFEPNTMSFIECLRCCFNTGTIKHCLQFKSIQHSKLQWYLSIEIVMFSMFSHSTRIFINHCLYDSVVTIQIHTNTVDTLLQETMHLNPGFA